MSRNAMAGMKFGNQINFVADIIYIGDFRPACCRSAFAHMADALGGVARK